MAIGVYVVQLGVEGSNMLFVTLCRSPTFAAPARTEKEALDDACAWLPLRMAERAAWRDKWVVSIEFQCLPKFRK